MNNTKQKWDRPPGPRWTAEEEHLLRLLRPTNSYAEIAAEFEKRVTKGLNRYRIRTTEAIRKKCQRDNITDAATAKYTEQTNSIKDQWKTINEIQTQYASLSVARSRGILAPGTATTKILCLSDLHIPLARLDLIAKVLNEHADADIVVLNGDILEGYIYSTFEKSRSIAALDEYRAGFALLKLLSESFPQVVITEGNHDDRAARALKGVGMKKDATQVLRPNLLARMANGEVLDQTGMLVEKLNFDNVIFEQRESWYVKIGKTIFIHPSTRGSSKPGWTVQKWYKKFAERYTREEFDSIVCGHTHQVYKGVWCSTLLIEQGCLAGLLAYSWKKNVIFDGNSQNGYAVIYQDADGNTDFNKSQVYFLGEVLPPKKSAIGNE
jgi:predicted phosphodiesterase